MDSYFGFFTLLTLSSSFFSVNKKNRFIHKCRFLGIKKLRSLFHNQEMLTSVTFEIFSCHNDIIAEVFNTIRIYIHLKSDIRISLTLPYTIQLYMPDHCTTALFFHHTVLFLSLNKENLSMSLSLPVSSAISSITIVIRRSIV